MKRAVSGAVFAALMPLVAHAQGPIKIGFITTFSGPSGVLGQDLADGFKLAQVDWELRMIVLRPDRAEPWPQRGPGSFSRTSGSRARRSP